MKKFYLPVFWKVSAYHIIEAETLEEAREVADDVEQWAGVHAHLDVLPKPEQEENCDDYDRFPDQMREATPEEIQTAEAPSAREALRFALTSLELLEGFVAGFEDDEAQENVRWMLETARTAITTARAALGLEVSE